MSRAAVFGLATAIFTLALTLACAELALRRLEGRPLFVLRLPPGAATASPSNRREKAADRYLRTIPLATGVDPAWYGADPPPRPDIPMTPEIARRYERYKEVDVYGAFFAWNREYLQHSLCARFTAGALGLLDSFYVFDPPAPTWYPTFRHLSNIRPPAWFPTNRFGWRGPDVTLNKPRGTIRIAFAGSSTTIDPYYTPFSHIEYIGEWLRLWAAARGLPYHIEVINAARTGIDTMSVAAIVEQELMPLEPDLVIYDGANDFGARMQLDLPSQRLTPPEPKPPHPWTIDAYSVFARRVHGVLTRLGGGYGSEPPRTPHVMLWPADVDQQHPDVAHVPLPMNLSVVLDLFEAMRTATETVGGKFALSSPVRMVRDGLTLNLPEDQTLNDSLKAYYPLTYAELQRLSDFHRRVFRAYADRHGLLYLDSSARYPLDPLLFGDTVHMTPAGLRLKAWIDPAPDPVDRERDCRRTPAAADAASTNGASEFRIDRLFPGVTNRPDGQVPVRVRAKALWNRPRAINSGAMSRDYNQEYKDGARKYAYDFDYVLRRYMLRALEPFVRDGKALEMGCYKGEVTELLAKRFSDLTVIEASDELVAIARERVGPPVRFLTGVFEEVDVLDRYESIFLMHTLEHLDEPTAVLRRVHDWLTETGRLFIVVPNANAPSRQIAVQMGLIGHNSAVTEAERKHGHRKTYSLDTLAREALDGGLRVVHRGGVFFKPLANFQFDKLMGTDVMSDEFLEGCYRLGEHYPDLCASVYVVCERSDQQRP